MPRRSVKTVPSKPDRFFVNELAGETPPALATMAELYVLAEAIYLTRPWQIVSESQLILTRDLATGETCYCSVMGTLGISLSVYVYIGAESYHIFRRVEREEISGAGEFYEALRSVYVEFVPRRELDAPDRKLVATFGNSRDQVFPVFRACRPGFYPWYVTEQEARLLAVCLQAVLATCLLPARARASYWRRAGAYPMLSPAEPEARERGYRMELVEPPSAEESSLPSLRLAPAQLQSLRNCNFPARGVWELDYFGTSAVIGEKGSRKACVSVAVAVDSDSGFVFSPEMTIPGGSVADALGRALIKAMEMSQTIPLEVRVRSQRIKNCLIAIAEIRGFWIKVDPSLPALEEFREELLRRF